MRRALKYLGFATALLFLVVGILLIWNWSIVRGLAVTMNASVTDVELFQPRHTVKGCPSSPLPRFTNDSPISTDVFNQMKAFSDSHGGVGLMVLVDGRVAGESYREGADEDTQTLSFSMHKSVLALAYGAAIEDGYIDSIDDPIGKYIEEWSDDPRGQIPPRAFLTMSSGLEGMSQTEWRAMKFNFTDAVTCLLYTSDAADE